jgi:hypothetical protein
MNSGIAKKKKKQTKGSSTTRSTNGLTCTDICKIISSCGKAGVSTLKYNGLDLEFGDNKELFTDAGTTYNNKDVYRYVNSGEWSKDVDNSPSLVHNTIDDPTEHEEMDDDTLMITNPELWEMKQEATNA